MDEQGCPRCKTTKYRNPSLKLMVNVCGHSLCESCVDLLFVKGSGVCPDCGTALRRSNFRLQIFEDALVEKEIDIRKRILRDFNKKEEDFPSLKEYNDYLEKVETIIFNLSNQLDVEATKKMVEQYKKDNKDQIRRNQARMSKEEEFLEALIEQEQHEASVRKMALADETKKEKASKRKHKEALLDDLMFSDKNAMDIISQHRETAKQEEEEMEAKMAATSFSTGIRIGHQKDSVPLPCRQEQAQLYRYCALSMEWGGPTPPSMDEVYSDGYLRNIRPATDAERAGGFRESIACHRALQDAFCGLFSYPTISAASGSQLTACSHETMVQS